MLEGGLTGNVIDDWVNAVTQGEYTKYDDVPEAKLGTNNGWTKITSDNLDPIEFKLSSDIWTAESNNKSILLKDAKCITDGR